MLQQLQDWRERGGGILECHSSSTAHPRGLLPVMGWEKGQRRIPSSIKNKEFHSLFFWLKTFLEIFLFPEKERGLDTLTVLTSRKHTLL